MHRRIRIRRYFPCDFYNQGSATLDPGAWAVWQYNDPKTGEGVVLAFRRAESPCDRVKIPLKGISAGAKVEIEGLDAEVPVRCMNGELEIELAARRSSTVVLYRVIQHAL